MKQRENFDWTCECGVWVCTECDAPFYPMELEEDDECPECLGKCRPATTVECLVAQDIERKRQQAEEKNDAT